ncbi:glycosyltransferase family 1 protein [bacterium]|nr:glycosyltransferase family 1 protein [bacterium]
MKKIIFTTIGSLGDLHPIMGVAKKLQEMGHQPIIAASEFYRTYIEAADISFHPVRPFINHEDPTIIKAVLDTKKGPEILHKNYIFPELRESVEDLLHITEGADLIVSSVLSYYVPMVSHISGVPWVNGILSPISMWSGYDPPILAPVPFLGKMRFLPPAIHHFILKQLFKVSEPWAKPLKKLRQEYGMSAGLNPFWEGLFQGQKTLCFWSKHFYDKKPDWPSNAITTGFVFYDPAQEAPLKEEVSRFIFKNDSVFIFTLGSTSILDPAEFLEIFYNVAKELTVGCIITTGKRFLNEFKKRNTDKVLFVDYIPYTKSFPLVDLVIHQGGVGTTANCLKAGIPQIVLPFCMDQFDNGYRVKRLGAGEVLERKRLTKSALLEKIQNVISSKKMKEAARAISIQMKDEDGALNAANAIIAVIN